jgi:hypothetical protein
MGRLLKDITGQKFGRLVAIEFSRIEPTQNKWRCLCDCGNECFVDGHQLRVGKTKSCGCFRVDDTTTRFTTHGDSVNGIITPEYKAWHRAKDRCSNENNPDFPAYGGRGITMCAEWQKSFIEFLKHMGRKPSPTHSLGRINNDGPYAPDNCRWETPTQQANNRRQRRRGWHKKKTLERLAKL